jgi:hypothetical protein
MAATDNLTKCLLASEEQKNPNDRCLASDRQATHNSLIPGKKAHTKESYQCIVCQDRLRETTNKPQNPSTGQDSNHRPPEYTADDLTITLPFMFI